MKARSCLQACITKLTRVKLMCPAPARQPNEQAHQRQDKGFKTCGEICTGSEQRTTTVHDCKKCLIEWLTVIANKKSCLCHESWLSWLNFSFCFEQLGFRWPKYTELEQNLKCLKMTFPPSVIQAMRASLSVQIQCDSVISFSSSVNLPAMLQKHASKPEWGGLPCKKLH